MKQLFITIICVSLALVAMAGVPKPDVARLRQAVKNQSVAAATSVGEGKYGQVSFHQFMRERNLSPNDNRPKKNAPSRGLQGNLTGMLAVAEVQSIEDFDESGFPVTEGTVFSMGWKVSVGNGIIHRFHGSYSLPFYSDGVNYYLESSVLRDDTISVGSARNRTDTIRWVAFITEDYWNYDDLSPIVGTIYDDGSIGFDGKYLVYSEDMVLQYRNGTLTSADTVCSISPMYSNLFLLMPNGVHEFYYSTNTDLSLNGLDTSNVDIHSIIVEGSGSSDSHCADGTVAVTQGVHPRPVDPRKTAPTDVFLTEVDPWALSWLNPFVVHGTIQAPVYMFQLEDCTVCIYNLYDAGYMGNIVNLHADGSCTLPPQVLFYDAGEDYYNCSVQGDSLQWGNTGVATPDSICWGVTVPINSESPYSYLFDNNKLYFTNGSHFEIPEEPTGLRGDVNDNQQVTIADVTALIDFLLTEDFDSINYDNADCNLDGSVTIADVTWLIDYLLSGQWP